MSTLTKQQEKHKGGPILYMVNNEHKGDVGSTKPLSLGDLWYGLDDVFAVMEGCLDMVQELEDANRCAEFRAPFLMMRVTLKYGMDHLWHLMPYADKTGRGIYAAKDDEGNETITLG